MIKLFFDGGCRPNPGRMEAAVVVRGQVYHWTDLGFGSSHLAEWRALLEALRIAVELGEKDVVLLGDAKAVVEQANGVTRRPSAELRECLDSLRSQSQAFERIRVRHIGRTQNLAGIALARLRDASRGGGR